MKNSLLRAVAATICALALTAPIGAAQADTQKHKDPRGDVKTKQFRAAARQPGIDIRKVVNTLEGDTLKMRIKIPNPARQYSVSWGIKTDDNFYGVDVSRYRDSSAISFYSVPSETDFRAVPKSRDATKVKCEAIGLRSRGNSVIVTIDRSCIDDATHLRIFTYTMRANRNMYMVDDAWQKGLPRRGRLKYGPRLNLN